MRGLDGSVSKWVASKGVNNGRSADNYPVDPCVDGTIFVDPLMQDFMWLCR